MTSCEWDDVKEELKKLGWWYEKPHPGVDQCDECWHEPASVDRRVQFNVYYRANTDLVLIELFRYISLEDNSCLQLLHYGIPLQHENPLAELLRRVAWIKSIETPKIS